VSPETGAVHKLLRGVLQRAVEWKRIPDNPARLVKLPAAQSKPEVRPLPPERVEAIRAHFLGRNQLDHAALVSLLGYAGLRPQEALALSWAHVRDRTLLIEQRVAGGVVRRSTKNRQNRTVRLLTPVVQELKERRMWQRRPSEEALLFPGPGGRPLEGVHTGQLEEARLQPSEDCGWRA